MITPISISRSAIGNSILHPVQRSANTQFAINNLDHLVLIEPKLPLLHECMKPRRKGDLKEPNAAQIGPVSVKIEPDSSQLAADLPDPASRGSESVNTDTNVDSQLQASDASKSQQEFLSSALFSVTPIFQIENLEQLGFQFFSRLLINDKENHFNFGRIQEPLIVSHKWSPCQAASRDSYLGVLLNTGEVMILKRETLDSSSYTVKFRTFTALLDQLRLSGDRLTADGDIIVSGAHFSELRVTDFSFGEFQGVSALFLSHESGDISIHSLAPDLPLLHRFAAGGLVVLSAWCTDAFYYVLSDNSVYRFSSEHGCSEMLKGASRFMVSNIQPVSGPGGEAVVVTDTAYIHILGSAGPKSARLPFTSEVCGLPMQNTDECLVVYLVFENGRSGVARFEWRTTDLSVAAKCPNLDAFTKRTLNRYSGVLAKEQARAPTQDFVPYLDDSAQGTCTVHGTSQMSGYLVMVYSLAPKNVISHVIKSKREYFVGFVPFSDLDALVEAGTENTESISQVLGLFLQSPNLISSMGQSFADSDCASVEKFALSLNLWKNTTFQDPSAVDLPLEISSSLSENLFRFRNCAGVKSLQKLYTTNHSVLRTLYAVHGVKADASSSKSGSRQEISVLERQQRLIRQRLQSHLAHILLSWAQAQASGFFTSDYDRFILNSYQKLVAHNYRVDNSQETVLVISGELCTEEFRISANQIVEDDFQEVVRSSTDHKWPRCSATLLPIMDISNKTDELETHNYLAGFVGNSYLAQAICRELDYCIFTGTRTWELRKGV